MRYHKEVIWSGHCDYDYLYVYRITHLLNQGVAS